MRNPRLDVKLIWLVRGGRGVAQSIMRNLEPSRWLQVRYEALCVEPEQTLERLWRFIGAAPIGLNERWPQRALRRGCTPLRRRVGPA